MGRRSPRQRPGRSAARSPPAGWSPGSLVLGGLLGSGVRRVVLGLAAGGLGRLGTGLLTGVGLGGRRRLLLRLSRGGSHGGAGPAGAGGVVDGGVLRLRGGRGSGVQLAGGLVLLGHGDAPSCCDGVGSGAPLPCAPGIAGWCTCRRRAAVPRILRARAAAVRPGSEPHPHGLRPRPLPAEACRLGVTSRQARHLAERATPTGYVHSAKRRPIRQPTPYCASWASASSDSSARTGRNGTRECHLAGSRS